jgi:hypothetical protein
VDLWIAADRRESFVDVIERVCGDEALASCGNSARYRILRLIAIR